MTNIVESLGQPKSGASERILRRQSLTVACAVFAVLAAIAYAPNILVVVGIHNDYELLSVKSLTFLHPEAEQLFRIARPVAALLSNVPVWPLQSLEDYRWSRLFSVITLCGLAAMMMAICTRRLGVRVVPAFCVTVGALMVPPFVYSVLNAAAWAPHLVSILAALAAYRMVSRANVQLLALESGARWDVRITLWQIFSYLRLKPVYRACLVYQLAFFDYPPNALVLVCFPVITVLFSDAPRKYRWLLASRDIAFVSFNVVLYSLATKLFYMPVAGLFLPPVVPPDPEINPFAARIAPSYRFDFNTDPVEFVRRLHDTLKVAGDVWFLPQLQFHYVVLSVAVVAVIAANISRRRDRESASEILPTEGLVRLNFGARISDGAVVTAVLAICFLIAASPVVASGGGFVTYRTIAIPTAIAGIVFLFAAAALAQFCWSVAGGARRFSVRVRNTTLILIAIVGAASNLIINYETMILARNEFGYFTDIMRTAMKNKSRLVVLYDPRPLTLPEDHPVVYDQQRRPIPPYELACFSGYCFQTGAIAHIASEMMGAPKDYITVFPMRPGDPFVDMDCPRLMASFAKPPEDVPDRIAATINWLKNIRPVTCVNYGLGWHDLGARYGADAGK